MKMSYDWHFTPLLQFGYLWVRGLWLTVGLSALSIAIGTLLSLPLVAALQAHSAGARLCARIYIDIFRAIPAVVLLGTLYFCFPLFTGFRLSSFWVAVIGLALNLAPFVAETIRGAIESIPTIQFESAFVMGFRGWNRTRYVVGPQVIQRLLPPLFNEYITTLKLTSLAAAIGVEELWNATSQITTLTSLPIEAKLSGAALYILIVLPLLLISAFLERRFWIKGLGEGRER